VTQNTERKCRSSLPRF